MDKEACRRLMKGIIKRKNKGISTKMIQRMEALFQIIQAKLKLMKEVTMFIEKMRTLAQDDVETGNINTSKLRSHTRRSLWLVSREIAPEILSKERERKLTKKSLREEVVKVWNNREMGEELRRRGLPQLEWGKKPQLWRDSRLSSGEKRLLVKWYIGKFPIPSKGAQIPRREASELADLMERDKPWKKQ